MTNSRLLSLAAFAVLFGLGSGATRTAMALEPPTLAESLRARIHSHNDYNQRMPLHEALHQGISSIEADVYYRHGELILSHEGVFSKGTLEDLYLKQLQHIVDHRGGSVY